jgi:hypothetical protein
MPFDADKFANYLTKNAGKHSQSHCARSLRLALEAGGANTIGHPTPAKEYGATLLRNAFHPITVDNPTTFAFQKGDIVVMEPTQHGNPAGHIAGYDGRNWVSDFVQRGFWPGPTYENEKPSYVVYRR